MKKSKTQLWKRVRRGGSLAFAVLIWSLNAKASVWWPEVKAINPNLSIFQDYDNAYQFYYIPRGAVTAINDETGKRMVSHGLFPNRFEPKNSVTQYHLTLVPQLTGADIDASLKELRRRYGSQASLSPLPITTVSFSVTQKHDQDETLQISSPFRVDVPNWTGNLHSFHQRFSVVMKGNMYMAEPAMSRFMTNKAGNAFVGTLHYGFRGVRRVFDGYMRVNIHQFVSSLKTHLSVSGFWSSVDIKTAIDRLMDEQDVVLEVVKDKGYENEVWDALVQKLVETVFEPAPNAPAQLEGDGGGDSFFSLKVEYAEASVDRVLTIRLNETEWGDYGGDIDITGGAMDESHLDSRIKFLCDMWAKFDRSLDSCVDVCEPMIEYYDPKTKECLPAFGGGL